MAKTNVRGAQIADGANGVDLQVDVTNTLLATNGGTGLNTSGVDPTKFLASDGAGAFVMTAVPTQNSFVLDGGASNTNYGTLAQIDCGSSL